MEKGSTNFDAIYLKEHDLQFEHYFELMKGIIDSNSNRVNSFIKREIENSLREIKISLIGYKSETSTYEDQYFMHLLSEFIRQTRNYKVNPIENFIQLEYRALRLVYTENTIAHKPEIYSLSDEETVSYLAQYNALYKLYSKICNIFWADGESVDVFFGKILDENYYEPGIDYGALNNYIKNVQESVKVENKTEDNPTLAVKKRLPRKKELINLKGLPFQKPKLN